jgi:hypothetical protein
MTTVSVGDLSSRVKNLYDKVNVLQANISSSYSYLSSGPKRNINTRISSEVRDLKEEADKYDTEFREHERYMQQTGGKTRHQTLQEFVLLFFFVGFGLLAISLGIFAYTTTRNFMNPIKIIGLMVFIALLVTAILIRYA